MNEHQRERSTRVLAGLVLVLQLGACAGTPDKTPEYEPAMPEPVVLPQATNGAIYQAHSSQFYFGDNRAARVGDVINVILDEQTNASKSASTNAQKDTSIDLPSPTLFGGNVTFRGRPLLSSEVKAGNQFTGSADSSQSNRLSGSVAVTVTEVYPNGNMRIEGQKLLTLNQGSEIVRVSGLVRAADITPENTVSSTRIAAANITYGGKGLLADSNRAGWLTRIVNGPLWPF